jgi:hypothetical protein
MFSNPLFKGHDSRLVDATEVTEFALSAETVRPVATAALERGLRRAALISNDTRLVYALMRLYEAYASPPAEVAVYHNRRRVCRSLAGIPASSTAGGCLRHVHYGRVRGKPEAI